MIQVPNFKRTFFLETFKNKKKLLPIALLDILKYLTHNRNILIRLDFLFTLSQYGRFFNRCFENVRETSPELFFILFFRSRKFQLLEITIFLGKKYTPSLDIIKHDHPFYTSAFKT